MLEFNSSHVIWPGWTRQNVDILKVFVVVGVLNVLIGKLIVGLAEAFQSWHVICNFVKDCVIADDSLVVECQCLLDISDPRKVGEIRQRVGFEQKTGENKMLLIGGVD